MAKQASKWVLLAFLFGAFFLELGTRQLYNAVLPQVAVEFGRLGVTDAQLGMVGSVFGAVFGVSLIASGLAADFFGRKLVLVAGTLLYSIGVLGSGFAGGVAALVLFYGVVNAMGQCCIAPAGYALITKYHKSTRSVAMAVFQSAVYFGIILSSMFGGVLAEMGDGVWRRAFWIMGAIGIAWAVAMQAGMRPEPAGAGEDGDGKASVKEAFLALLRKPTAVLIAVRGTSPYFNVVRGMYRMTGADGANEWVPDETGPHLRVTEKMSKAEVGRVLDELMLRLPRRSGKKNVLCGIISP